MTSTVQFEAKDKIFERLDTIAKRFTSLGFEFKPYPLAPRSLSGRPDLYLDGLYQSACNAKERSRVLESARNLIDTYQLLALFFYRDDSENVLNRFTSKGFKWIRSEIERFDDDEHLPFGGSHNPEVNELYFKSPSELDRILDYRMNRIHPISPATSMTCVPKPKKKRGRPIEHLSRKRLKSE